MVTYRIDLIIYLIVYICIMIFVVLKIFSGEKKGPTILACISGLFGSVFFICIVAFEDIGMIGPSILSWVLFNGLTIRQAYDNKKNHGTIFPQNKQRIASSERNSDGRSNVSSAYAQPAFNRFTQGNKGGTRTTNQPTVNDMQDNRNGSAWYRNELAAYIRTIWKNVYVLPSNNNPGVDILATLSDGRAVAVKCVYFSSGRLTDSSVVQQVYKAKTDNKCSIALLVTSVKVDTQVQEYAKSLGVKIWQGWMPQVTRQDTSGQQSTSKMKHDGRAGAHTANRPTANDVQKDRKEMNIMDWNARFQQAHALWEAHKFSEASRIFEEVAEATMDPAAIRATIAAQMSNNAVSVFMVEEGAPGSEFTIKDIDNTIKWIRIARQNDAIMAETPDAFDKEYRVCVANKGICLYWMSIRSDNILIDNGCEATLLEAVKLGDNQSRIRLAKRYMIIVRELMKQGYGIDSEKVTYYNSRTVPLLEAYLDKYDPQEADEGDLKLAVAKLTTAYYKGEGVPRDEAKAIKYQELSSSLE